jgi:hypothetical protein
MKLFSALVGAAAAVAPPRIELSLDGNYVNGKLSEEIYRAHDQGRTNLDHTHYRNNLTPDAPDGMKRVAVQSRQDWTEKCAAGVDTLDTCHFPIARAYDFVDQKLRVSTRVFMVDRDDRVMLSPECMCGCNDDDTVHTACDLDTNITMDHRATYLFKYDATDNSGNHAEQVVFALIVDDLTPPTFIFHNDLAMNHSTYHHEQWGANAVATSTNGLDANDGNFKFDGTDFADKDMTPDCWQFDQDCDPNNATSTCQMTVQASRYPSWGLAKCTTETGIQASDNVDATGDVTDTIKYSIWYDGAPYVCTADDTQGNGFRPARCSKPLQAGSKLEFITPEQVSNYLGDYGTQHDTPTITLKIHAHDFAGVYGKNSRNNEKTVNIVIQVEDTLPPQCFVHGLNPTHLECRGSHSMPAGWSEADGSYKRCTPAQFSSPQFNTEYYCDGGVGCYDELDGDLKFPETEWPDGSQFGISVAKFFGDTITGTNEQKFRGIGLTCNTTSPQCENSKYEITYSAEDSNSRADSGMAIRTVFVTDTVAPTITIAGVDSVTSRAAQTVNGSQTTVCEDLSHTTTHNGSAINVTHSVCAHSSGSQFYDPGIMINDMCEEAVRDEDKMSGEGNFWDQPLVNGTAGCPTSDDSAYIASDNCWGGNVFNERKVGKYIRTYHIRDTAGNNATATRTFHVVDMTAPEIQIFGESIETFEASRDVEYTDQGAKCMDYVDGDISHNVEVSGEIVNMKVPGTYHIQYDCQDNNGNMAVSEGRAIVIEDNGDPILTLTGDQTVYVEAGFPYKDAGATATDTLDGDITSRVRSVGNTVSTAELFYTAGSCAQIKHMAERTTTTHYQHTTNTSDPRGTLVTRGDERTTARTALRQVGAGYSSHSGLSTLASSVKSGEYYISVAVGGKRQAMVVTCDFSDPAGPVTYFKLDAQRYMQDFHAYGPVLHNTTCEKTTSSACDETHAHDASTWTDARYSARYPKCSDYGFVNFASDPADGSHRRQFADAVFGSQFVFHVPAGEQTDRRLCTFIETTPEPSQASVPTDPQLRAETGDYKIWYMVTDLNNNAAAPVSRDVYVRDTLAPVLTLKYRGQVLNTAANNNHVLASAAPHSTQNYTDLKNPAYYATGQYKNGVNDTKQQDDEHAAFGNPQFTLMAQAATTNGWIIAAVASAIAGVALLSFSSKSAETSVPV